MAPPATISTRPPFGFDPATLPREMRPHYIGPNPAETGRMLASIGLTDLGDLYAHLPPGILHDGRMAMPAVIDYEARAQHAWETSIRNRLPQASFLGDGLQQYRVTDIIPFLCGLRGLTTAYTSYQPEIGQGTLMGLWIYQSAIATLTGFEAVNASLYDRATGIFEAARTAARLAVKEGRKKANTVLVLESIYPGDMDVLETLSRHSDLNIKKVKIDPATGVVDPAEVRRMAAEIGEELAGIVFPQVNSLGNLEDVDALTDLCDELKVKSIAVIDPMLMATGGLIPPSQFGSEGKGTTMFVGEGQHLAIGPNFGGPGLGIFGIRFNEADKQSIHQTPGRFVGSSHDLTADERPAKLLILSPREQHIRREKAMSNICTNQAFVALLVGAAILYRGEEGMKEACAAGLRKAHEMARRLSDFVEVRLRFPDTPFFNEFVLSLPCDVDDFIEEASLEGIHVGVNVSRRTGNDQNTDLLISFSDIQTDADLERLERLFEGRFHRKEQRENIALPETPARFLREGAVELPNIASDELRAFYLALNAQNVSPDNAVFPLGSCTMKYNPWLNDWAAALAGFATTHPEAPEADVQGDLQVLFDIQEMFKAITGLPGVTTQPVAGAQGELVALKMFQAYHADHDPPGHKRDIIIVPDSHSAHGTNPATAAYAGYQVIEIHADSSGKINLDDLQAKIAEHGSRIAGIMVTNPNTSGVFETRFREMADRIHAVGGLVFMDGANMNAIAGWVNLKEMGVDAVHNNLHKTWSIPHGGGGPGDGMVAVSNKLVDYLPGAQVVRGEDGNLRTVRPPRSIGSFHRHHGNFAHKVRAWTYLLAFGAEGVRRMSATAVLAARYLYNRLSQIYPTIPAPSQDNPIMHEFILTLSQDLFASLTEVTTTVDDQGRSRKLSVGQIVARVGKLFLDFGLHAPTVAFPSERGLMIEPTESFTQDELDRFADIVLEIHKLLEGHPKVLRTTPHHTPVGRVEDTEANRRPVVSERLGADWSLPAVIPPRLSPEDLFRMPVTEIARRIVEAHGLAEPTPP